ncbi:MAG: hypothetical protein ACKOWJ_05230 [Micrococcales bacterium]
MADFDQEKFKKKLKKKIKKSVGGNVVVKSKTGGFYFVGFIGAAIYFVSVSNGFWDGVLGVLKALVWPAFLVFDALTALHA